MRADGRQMDAETVVEGMCRDPRKMAGNGRFLRPAGPGESFADHLTPVSEQEALKPCFHLVCCSHAHTR